ncbi:RNA polymerase sigma factor [Kordiimonas sp. SCSIO 12610]|uniref:RNA polymerase sigma factor n=1 Tax=Kordiimonas sp. SCSIO 12610 TaxID=2829597 RepID=UPI00210BB1DD|nr:RNA polymerase sigma factor [Kordiimonas sp. SCSIO 12610]UTW55835.1 RNA polymerase sigma factor [Kordiimonas sp. SCSIO 12610]
MAKIVQMSGNTITASLIAASKSGNEYAFERLVRLYQSPVRAFARRLSAGDSMFADDLAQETFIQAHRKLEGFDGSGKFVSWLYRIAYRLFLDHVRKVSRRDAIMDGHETHTECEANTEVMLEMRYDIETAFSYLKYEERTAITLCLSEGMSHSEASEIMDMPIGTVKSHIMRGRDKLKTHLRVWQQERVSK